jgi:hypothetical protein
MNIDFFFLGIELSSLLLTGWDFKITSVINYNYCLYGKSFSLSNNEPCILMKY